MKTYLSIIINSEGGLPSDITDKLKAMGFETTLGSHDFVYAWPDPDTTHEKVVEFINKVQEDLKGQRVRFTVNTER